MIKLGLFNAHRFWNLKAFYYHNVLKLLAISMFDVFSSIYMYQILRNWGATMTEALSITCLLLALMYLAQLIFVAPSIVLIKKYGLKVGTVIGTFFLLIFLISINAASVGVFYLISAMIWFGFYLGIYFTCHHILFMEISDNKHQGSEMGMALALPSVAGISGPLIGGMLIESLGFGTLFLISGVLLLGSSVPLYFIKGNRDYPRLDFGRIKQVLISKKEISSMVAISGEAVVFAATLFVWPLAVYFAVGENIKLVGLNGSLIALFSIFTTILVGLMIDRVNHSHALKIISVVDMLHWIVKFLFTGQIVVFVWSGVQAITSQAQVMLMDTLIYQKSRDLQDNSYIIQREVGFGLFKSIFFVILSGMFWLGFSLSWAFVLVAVMAILTRFYRGAYVR